MQKLTLLDIIVGLLLLLGIGFLLGTFDKIVLDVLKGLGDYDTFHTFLALLVGIITYELNKLVFKLLFL